VPTTRFRRSGAQLSAKLLAARKKIVESLGTR